MIIIIIVIIIIIIIIIKITVSIILCWGTLTSSQVSNRDGVVLEIYLDHIFQWPQEGLNCEPLTYEVVT